jgi:ectoine hydroxylase-related dioxygenase (phytanoyl-CoA dioxygenase family)
MNTDDALELLGVKPTDLTDEQRNSLDEFGYCIVENVLTPEECAEINAEIDRIVAAEQDRAGTEVSVEAGATRISNVFNKSTAFDRLLELKPLLAASRHLIKGDFKVHGANMREPHKGHGQQPIHTDAHKMSDGSVSLVNGVITFDDHTLENGPTRIVPGSHKWPTYNVPGENAIDRHEKKTDEPHKWAVKETGVTDESVVLDDAPDVGEHEPADPFAPYPGEMKVVVPPGTLVILNSHLWHSGTEKRDDSRRRQFHLTYTPRSMPQQLIQKDYVTEELRARMSDAHKYLLDID